MRSNPNRIFLLSPASVAGRRAALVLRENSGLEIAHRLRGQGVQLGELFSFISSLYFRGKLAYASAFSGAPRGIPGVFIITASGGLMAPDSVVTLESLRQITASELDLLDPRYRVPLDRDARLLVDSFGTNCEVVLLGSIATAKYVDPLLSVFGERLVCPRDFVGRGDMSRGGLLLRCVASKQELTYISVCSAVRHGCRPPKLKPLPLNAR